MAKAQWVMILAIIFVFLGGLSFILSQLQVSVQLYDGTQIMTNVFGVVGNWVTTSFRDLFFHW